MINLKQYGLILMKYAQSQNLSLTAKQAGVDRQTARKYIQAQVPPDQLQEPHAWRTRLDSLAKVWSVVEPLLHDAPELEAKALFEHFVSGLQAALGRLGKKPRLERLAEDLAAMTSLPQSRLAEYREVDAIEDTGKQRISDHPSGRDRYGGRN